jgi:hypothetical protein
MGQDGPQERSGGTVGPFAWRVIGTGSGLLAVVAAQKGLSTAWRIVTGDDPPTIPEDPETDWGEAIAWAIVSGAVLGVARLLATRRAAQFYMRSTGELPKALQRST